jgi:hypothetical protein
MPTSIPETESAVQASTSSGAAYTSTSNDEKSGKKKEKDATLFRIWLDFALSPKIFRVPGGTGSGQAAHGSGTCLPVEVTYWWKLGGEPAVFGCLVASQS